MDMNLLKKITDIESVSGNEKLMSNFLKSEYEKFSDEIVYDNLGSIFAVKKSKKKNASRVMVVGHMDESGFIVKKINDNGTLSVLMLGHIEKNSLLGVTVQTRTIDNKIYKGTILAYNEQGDALNNSKESIVDFGFDSAIDVVESGISVGNRISLSNSINITSNENRIVSRNWNGRYAPILGIEILRELSEIELEFDLYVGCTVQEQVGFRGIQTATNVVQPDLGIVLDTNKAFDYQVDVKEKIGVLGKGLLINFYDPTVLPNRLLIKTLKDICEMNSINYQYYYSLEGSDAAWINKLRTGTPTLFINVPIRNMDTQSSILDIRDYNSSKQALLTLLQKITNDNIQQYKEENR